MSRAKVHVGETALFRSANGNHRAVAVVMETTTAVVRVPSATPTPAADDLLCRAQSSGNY